MGVLQLLICNTPIFCKVGANELMSARAPDCTVY